jgi:Uma2 family endonuclease
MSAVAAPQTVISTEALPEPLFRLSVSQYRQMIKHGILAEDDPVELLEGYLVQKMPKNRAHSHSTQATRDAVAAALPASWFIDVQEPFETEDSEPEPDLSVIRGDRKKFARKLPRAKDLGMLVEVSDSSLKRDRGFKKRLYAAARVAIYWIVNLRDRQVEVYTLPSGPGKKPDYRRRYDYAANEEVPLVLDGVEVGRLAVKDILP